MRWRVLLFRARVSRPARWFRRVVLRKTSYLPIYTNRSLTQYAADSHASLFIRDTADWTQRLSRTDARMASLLQPPESEDDD